MEQVQEVATTVAVTPWASDWNFQLIKLLIMTAVFIVVVVLFQVYGNIAEISQNFAKYRCNPAIMPFAGLFGQNATENFSFCMKQILSGQAASVFGPIYTILANFVAIMTTMSGSLMSLRTMFANFYGGVNSFISNFQRRIQSLLLQIRLSFIKMQNLMGRVYGTMMATMFMGMSAITAGTSLGDNSLVKFIFATAPCFAPDTPVLMADGSWKPISMIALGDSIQGMDGGSHTVTAVFRFDGRQTPMVLLGSNTISTTHYVRHNGAWIPAVDHPSALPTQSLPEIWCLNVAGHHAFFIGDVALDPLCVADYRESSDPHTLAAAAAVADKGLNGRAQPNLPVPAHYTFGAIAGTKVALVDGTFRTVEQIHEGDVLEGSGRVYGIVQEQSPAVAGSFGPAQYVWSSPDECWRRASELFEIQEKSTTLYSVFTTGCSAIRVFSETGAEFFIRDYAEVPLPEMETPFETHLQLLYKHHGNCESDAKTHS